MNLRDIAACLGWVIGFLSCALWLPLLGPVAGLLTPLPFFYYSFRAGPARGAVMTIVVVLAVILLGSVAGFTKMAVLAAEYGLLGYLLSRLLAVERSLAETVGLASAVLATTGVIAILLMAALKGVNVIEAVTAYIAEEFRYATEAYRQSGLVETQGEDLELTVKGFVEVFSRLLPSLMVVGTVLVVWLNTLFARFIAGSRGLAIAKTPPATLWQVPEKLVWFFIAAGFAAFLSQGLFQWAALNVLVVLTMVYFFQGLCILIFYLNKHKAPPWMRFGAYALIALQQLFILVLALAGLFDQWLDLRKIHKRAQ
jgi:uncharacterized protein YybS (DUF2232 family)